MLAISAKCKDGKQIAGIANGFIAAANEEYVLGNKTPLWLFGFMYRAKWAVQEHQKMVLFYRIGLNSKKTYRFSKGKKIL